MTARFASSRFAHLAALVCVVALLVTGCGQAPQLGGEENFGAADALWTAITAKDPKLLDACASRIAELHQATKMSDDAFTTLEEIIATARTGEWSDARVALKAFVRAQRPAAK